MFRTIVVREFGTYHGKRGERLLLRAPAPKGADAHGPTEPAPGAEAEANAATEPATAAKRGRGAPRREEEIPFFRVGEVVLPARGASVSSELIEACAERGIPITFLGSGGQPFAMLTSPMLTATIATRRAQLRAMDQTAGAELARAFVAGKLRNQASLLVYFAKAEKDDPARRDRVLEAAALVRKARHAALEIEGARPDTVRDLLMGTEGLGGRAYWSGVKALLEDRIAFAGREGRGAVDPVNALLNYGYGILASRAWAALLHAGLDPFAGMLHADRSGKPSLALDLMEELRAPAVDRAVLAHVRLGQPVRFEGSRLDERTRTTIADAVLERLDAPVMVAGHKLKLGSIVQRQARAIATHVRGEGAYKPFAMTW
jgi:CRISPR-associated protein Cas1